MKIFKNIYILVLAHSCLSFSVLGFDKPRIPLPPQEKHTEWFKMAQDFKAMFEILVKEAEEGDVTSMTLISGAYETGKPAFEKGHLPFIKRDPQKNQILVSKNGRQRRSNWPCGPSKNAQTGYCWKAK